MRAHNRYGCVVDHDACLVHSMPTINRFGCEKQTRNNRLPREGDVYRHLYYDESRRVIHVGKYTQKSEGEADRERARVCFSSGGDHNRWIYLESFLAWSKGATLIHEQKDPTP